MASDKSGIIIALKQESRSAAEAAKRAGFYRNAGKRAIDFAIAFAGLLILSPLMIVVAILVKCTSLGPILYLQNRVGRGGKTFRIAKFRSMVADADRKGPGITASDDPRVTRLGAMLRESKIDELPQLWNVLRGDMSLVGPRPELPAYVAGYTCEQRRVLTVRPGLTDIASIRYRHEEKVLAESDSPEEFYRSAVLPHKLALNIEYIDHMSLSFDTRLIFQTLKCLFEPPPSGPYR
jgi:lipopolysaccharide/colanic/teichoic acid biosynthesis glycosyltransferase